MSLSIYQKVLVSKSCGCGWSCDGAVVCWEYITCNFIAMHDFG